jgi:hypothetical protein
VADDATRSSLGNSVATASIASLTVAHDSITSPLADEPSNLHAAAYISTIAGQLAAAVTAVQASEAQKIQAAEAQKAAAAAQEAAAIAASAHQLSVWTAGWQGQINACRGAVDISAHYQTPTVAERWTCGGSAFPTAPGTLIHISGQRAGTYRVVGVVAVLNAYVDSASMLPHGYDLLFQTCRGDNAHTTEFVALRPA